MSSKGKTFIIGVAVGVAAHYAYVQSMGRTMGGPA
jgi:hypothetical protein